MRKWTYLVAALLVGGATTTFTGCIDNDEPAGIEQLRGAKAEFIKAKAAYESALTEIQLVKVEREKVKLEKDQVDLELKKCSLEAEQAKTAEQKAYWEAEAQKRTEEFKAKMFNLQTLTAQAEYNNKKALMDIEVALLTMKDDVYTAKIKEYRDLLVGYYYPQEGAETRYKVSGALDDLSEAKATLMRAEVEEINYLSQNKYYLEELQLDKTHATKTLEIQQSLLEEYKALDATGTDSKVLADKLKGYKTDLQALDAKEDEAYTKIEEMRKPIFPINQQIIEEKIKLDAQSSAYTLAKADVDPALVSGLYSALSVEEGEGALVEDLDKIFVEDAWDAELLKYQYTMKKDVVVKDLSLNEKATKIGAIANAIKAYYQGENSEAFDASGKLLDAYKTKFENELKRLEIDKKPAYAQFKADSITWIDAYAAYVGALKAYNNYKGANTYQAIKKEITTYNSLKAEDKKLETANTLRTSILGYLEKRKAVDGLNVEFATNYKDALTDANLATFNEAIATAVSNDISSLIGNETLATSFNAKAEGSTLSAFLEANQALFGGSTLNLEKSIEPKEVSANKYDMPKNVSQLIEDPDENSGSFIKYSNLAQESNYLANLDKWQALYAKIKAEADPVLAEVEAINENIEKLEAQIKDENAALWQAELACYLIKGDKSERKNNIFSEGNPYKDYYTSNEQKPLLGNVVTEYSKIEAEIALVGRAMEDGYFYYTYYDADSHTYKVSENSKTLKSLLEYQEGIITKAKSAVETIDNKIALFEKFGYTNNEGNEQYLDLLKQNIEKAQRTVDEMQAAVDGLNATLKKLLDAYAAE
ncbi:hypothetical protein K0E75_08725 [Bacteroides fragilis]|uniref:hypothetical protein n=1 Tax=Bacteroides fragilis TaxID=817 RepID=UPI00203081FE|nr:hypothetical protein [Bacteroides fragilis]MCE8587604.1 hypothetical protein [Bacteroides fragilis]MCE8591030.1 hypothetical protein [Bacteroides fragilis]MCE8658202.1 hypothetical protein [Bacteroides fragilis]MCE8660905.1 hypothetical protein [Bacteroides fragilis]MCM0262484.1 hypothetical protein [Bacteroides fragilis]